jgi:transposase-like protein
MTTLPANVTHPCYRDEDAAREMFEAIRWPNGPFCPTCGAFDTVAPLGGESMGAGWYWCTPCRLKFTVRVGSVLERSHIPLYKWLIAFRLYGSSKEGFSAHQLHRTLGIAYRSAWFMAHRIREAMHEDAPAQLGGEGKTIEMDDTFFGQAGSHDPDAWIFVNKRGWVKKGGEEKMRVMTLVERGGKARSIKVDRLTGEKVYEILQRNAKPESTLNTDEASVFITPGRGMARHETVTQSAEEYVRYLKDGTKAHTNTVEGYFSIFKRGMIGVYQHCGEKHLHRYLAEFDFRYSNRVALKIDDAERSERAIKGIEAKPLTYRRTRRQIEDEIPLP